MKNPTPFDVGAPNIDDFVARATHARQARATLPHYRGWLGLAVARQDVLGTLAGNGTLHLQRPQLADFMS